MQWIPKYPKHKTYTAHFSLLQDFGLRYRRIPIIYKLNQKLLTRTLFYLAKFACIIGFIFLSNLIPYVFTNRNRWFQHHHLFLLDEKKQLFFIRRHKSICISLKKDSVKETLKLLHTSTSVLMYDTHQKQIFWNYKIPVDAG